MEIYIEYLLIDNLIINSLIIYLTSRFSGFKMSKRRIFLSSLFATMFSFVFPFFNNFNFMVLLFLKLVVGFIITLILKKHKSFLGLIVCFLLFVTSTFIVGGFVYGLINILGLSTTLNGLLINNFEIPMGVVVLVLCLYVILLNKLINCVKNRCLHSSEYVDVFVNNLNKIYKINAYYDTGNGLYDNLSNKPINMISLKLYKKIVDYACDYKNSCVAEGLKNMHYVSVKTISGCDKVLVFEIDALKILNKNKSYKFENVCVGVSKTNFGEFDCLLHKDFIIN